MKPDITSRTDIEKLVNAFYEKVKTDELLQGYFAYMNTERWQKHLTTMYNFWENVVFYTGSYEGNPMMVHVGINQRHPLSAQHFKVWVTLFVDTVNNMFEGKNAHAIITRASNIAEIMQITIFK